MKSLVYSAAAAALLIGSSAQAADITIGVPSWPSAKAGAAVLKNLAEREFGANVTLTPGTNPVIFAAMASGKGDMDVHPEVWLPNIQGIVDEYKDNVVLGDTMFEGEQGDCVTKATAEKLGLSSITDLADPEIAKQFDSNGDGKGEFWVGATGWASANTEKVKMRGYGLADLYEPETIDEALAYARIGEKDKKGEPYVFYCYTPHHIFAQYDLVMLDEPAHDDAKWNMIQPDEDPQWYEKSSVSTAWKPAEIHLAYSKSLEERAPELITLFENYKPTSDMVADWTYQIAVKGRDEDELAQEWIADHPDVVDKWLGL
ncbi:glycine betaine ABC transporter substrate-binding protein [Afifella marina]|uniref:Glycine betaine/proline transport system substrate-binding protein n=1 Tax=Afifella marina DSM 2698 TaxID=1120955 RepID=A0A1G5NH51_AFIMA|nr:glycine betaine ABC transporter substrate-binding protein [Afifella marina]SCZ36746.1 glycine betaine/proline transport system substrate-binding protein [Afifella marina DSM 2698]